MYLKNQGRLNFVLAMVYLVGRGDKMATLLPVGRLRGEQPLSLAVFMAGMVLTPAPRRVSTEPTPQRSSRLSTMPPASSRMSISPTPVFMPFSQLPGLRELTKEYSPTGWPLFGINARR